MLTILICIIYIIYSLLRDLPFFNNFFSRKVLKFAAQILYYIIYYLYYYYFPNCLKIHNFIYFLKLFIERKRYLVLSLFSLSFPFPFRFFSLYLHLLLYALRHTRHKILPNPPIKPVSLSR